MVFLCLPYLLLYIYLYFDIPKNGIYSTTMKFRDIPQYASDGHYQINVGLGNLINAIDQYKADYHLQLNPDFQRGYVWTEHQQTAFVEFFLKCGKSSRVIYFNCPGWMGSKDEGTMVCVDGLQRLTALTKFLENNLPIFGGNTRSDFDEKIRFARAEHNLIFNVNSLATRKEVLQWYLDLNHEGTPHSNEELERVKKLIAKEK